MSTYTKAHVSLIENSMAGNPPKEFPGQTVVIDRTPPTYHQGADGHVSPAYYVHKVLWHGGKASDLENITNVKIVDKNGAVILDADVNRNYEQPEDTSQGVLFNVYDGT